MDIFNCLRVTAWVITVFFPPSIQSSQDMDIFNCLKVTAWVITVFFSPSIQSSQDMDIFNCLRVTAWVTGGGKTPLYHMLWNGREMMFVMLLWGKLKFAWPRWQSNPRSSHWYRRNYTQFQNITNSNRLDLVSQLVEHWIVSQRSRVRFPPWSGKLFSLPGVDAHSE